MTDAQLYFFIAGTLMIFYTSFQEYINLNKFSEKDLFSGVEIYNIDLIATRIYGLLKSPEDSKFLLYPYFWTMLILSIVGTYQYFNNSFLFNLLTLTLLVFFFMQYKKLILKTALSMEDNNISYTYDNIYKELEKEEWAIQNKKVKLKFFTKEILDKYGFESKEYGDINFVEKVDLNKEPILAKFKQEDDILYKDINGNIYDVLNYGKKPEIRRVIIKFSPLFSAFHKEEDISKKMLFSGLEALTSSFVFYLAIIGFDFTIK